GASISPIQADLLRETMDAVLRTDSQEKVDIITRLLKFGLEAPTDAAAMAAKRFVRTVGRLDELEFRVVLSLRGRFGKASEFKLNEIQESSKIESLDLVRTALSVLVSEGIVRETGGDLEKWQLT